MLTMNATLLPADITEFVLDQARQVSQVAWDIETTGLNWRADRIATCQLAIGDELFIVKLDPDSKPAHLSSLLSDPTVRKIFHHAPFDVRFMSARWDVAASNIACTKIAAKITLPRLPDGSYSLKSVLHSQLGVEIDKTERFSDWEAPTLSDRQLNYAASDVAYLPRLLKVLETRGLENGTWDQVEESFRYIPTRAKLDISGVGDVFTY